MEAALAWLKQGRTTKSPKGPAGKRCYVIGDVHGCLDLLDDLLARIELDLSGRPARETVVVFLGDLIDRGPDSCGVLERLRTLPATFPRVHVIMGNHEEILLRGLSGEPELLVEWLEYGGYECLQSYGAAIGPLFGASPDVVARAVAGTLPQVHVDFMRGFIDAIEFGDYLLVHAGIQPGVPLDRQGRAVRWVREGFLDSDENFGWMVVHGHTVSEEVVRRSNRIGIDTGAYLTGRLTALRLEDEEWGLLEATITP